MIVILDTSIIVTPLMDFFLSRIQDNEFPVGPFLVVFIGFIGIFFASLVSGLWISFWQKKENPLIWIFGAIPGVVLINAFKIGEMEYSFLLPASFFAWIGGRIGRKYRLKFLRNQNENKGNN
jgi:uncharacterized membrane protein YeaQ/YmgE (transglycosylase-associated protein family)